MQENEIYHTNKWYIHKPESILDNKTHEILWDSEIKTDHLIPARRLNLVLINKNRRTYHQIDFTVPVGNRVKIKKKAKR